ncbi:MAG: hypothetical protein J2P17_19105, partial [Mycobacterium sp.]|nr:hypothetical protein [Mycobacterium sp.]
MAVDISGPAASGISGSGFDDSAWPGLYTSASGANNTYLLFDPDVAKAAYNACSTLLGNIETMMNTIQPAEWQRPIGPVVAIDISAGWGDDSLPSAAAFRKYL